jgi:protocatechuate 3,4-dioxygenase beta subunit
MGSFRVGIGGRRAAAGALLGLLVAAGPAAAQAGRVVGRVTDAAGKPVRGASVVLVASDSAAAPARREVTGETGGFDFSTVQPGVYTLRASGAGYRERVVRVELAPRELESVVTRLPLARLADEPRRQRPRQR